MECIIKILKPNIICLTEVLPKNTILEHNSQMYTLDGYTMVDSNLKGRGICLYCKPEVKYQIIDNIPEFNEVVACEFIGKTEVFLLLICYRSPNSSMDNDGNLCDLLLNISQRHYSNIFVVGDFNYCNIDWNLKITQTPSVSASQFLDTVNDLFFEQLVSEPTRYRKGQRKNILDLVLSNNLFFVDSIDYCEPLGRSDHLSLVIYLNFELTQRAEVNRKMYYNGDYVAMNAFFNEFDWTNLMDVLNTQQSWDFFTKKTAYAIEKFIPICNKSSPTGKDWVNSKVRVERKNKKQSWSKLWKQIKSNRIHSIQNDNSALEEEWILARNKATKTCDEARSQYESRIILNCKTNPKTFWSYVKKKTKKPGDVSTLEDRNGQLVSNDSTKAKLLNDYFSSVFVNEADDNFYEKNINPTIADTIDTISINEDIILTAIDKLNVSKAPGPDGLHARIIKECKESFSIVFSIIFKKSLQEGALPKQWKQAHVKALFKKGKRTQCSNYRPVSLTSIVCKLFESIIRDNITQFLETHSLITTHQHGFRSGHSCTTQLLELMEDFTDFYEEEIPYDCIYLDFAKAFDRVPHQRVLTKLYNLGIRGKLINWIKDFLHGREQRVVINNNYSDWTNVVSGIPQGSVLGPTLFTIFINDIPVDINSSIKIFADDTKLYNDAHLSNLIQNDLNKLVQWSNIWLLPFNIDKCKVLHYGKLNPKNNYMMNDIPLSAGPSIKDLGITFQDNLRFDEHISKITSTANSRLGIIKNTFHSIDEKGFMILFKSNVRPVLEYGIPVWQPHLRKHEKEIEQIQRRATRMIKGFENFNYSERLHKLYLPTLHYRRRRCDLIQVFKIIKKFDNIDSDSFFQFNHGITRKNHIYKLNKPRCNSSQKMHSFSHRIINDWNDLPSSVGEINSINAFKSLLEDHWKHADFKYNFVF